MTSTCRSPEGRPEGEASPGGEPGEAFLLEVIALDENDAIAAERGGADRLEVVTSMESDGLTPKAETVERILAAVDIPVRVMLRPHEGFAVGSGELSRLLEKAARFAELGAEGFVCGFLDERGELDTEAMVELLPAMAGRPWTLHRAFDHCRNREAALSAAAALGGCDTLLTAGSPAGLADGLEAVCDLAAGSGRPEAPRIMAGGGLRPDLVGRLAAAGVDAFHIGSAAREGWDDTIHTELVRGWVKLLRLARENLPG